MTVAPVASPARAAFLARRIATCLRVADPRIAELVEVLIEEWQTRRCAPRVRDCVSSLGLHTRWNCVLDRDRAEFLAARSVELVPALRDGVVFDVLSGTGTVATALRRRGVTVREYERHEDYSASCSPLALPLDRLDGDLADHDGEHPVVLLGAVLHHEPSPADLLARIRRAAPRASILVTENPLVGSWGDDEHRMFDWLFNSVVNDFGVATPGEHRTIAGWNALLSRYGEVTAVRVLTDVPGIPFPYSAHLVRAT